VGGILVNWLEMYGTWGMLELVVLGIPILFFVAVFWGCIVGGVVGFCTGFFGAMFKDIWKFIDNWFAKRRLPTPPSPDSSQQRQD